MIYTVTPYRGRTNYLKLMLATLREAARGHAVRSIIINTSDGEVMDPVLEPILSEMHWLSYYRMECRDPHQVHALSINHAFKFFENPDWLVTIDSDMILHPKALSVCEKMFSDLPDMGIGCIFNTEEHPDGDDIGNGYVKKNIVGFTASIIVRSAWQNIGSLPDDINACNEMRFLHRTVYCTKNSYAEHMGFEGLNRRHDLTDHSRCVDRARRFMNE